MTHHDNERQPESATDEPFAQERRDFLRSLGKWSQAVISGVVIGGALMTAEPAEAWYNRPGWYNRRGGWYNRPSWYNRPGGWYNRHGGGGGWYNRHGGGGGWYNR